MIDTELDDAVHGPRVMGAHKSEANLSKGFGYEHGEPVLVQWPEELFAELADSRWGCEGVLDRVLDAVCGDLTADAMTTQAVCNRLFEFRRLINPHFEIPEKFKAKKATRSRALKQVFARLDIKPIKTARTPNDETRRKLSEAASEHWRSRKKNPVIATQPGSMNENSETHPQAPRHE